MIAKLRMTSALLGCLVLLPSCFIHNIRMSVLCDDEFWEKSPGAQRAIVEDLPIEQQFYYHTKRYDCTHPASVYGFAKEISQHPDEMESFFEEVLSNEPRPDDVFGILTVLVYMKRHGTFESESYLSLREKLGDEVVTYRRGFTEEASKKYYEELWPSNDTGEAS